MKYYIAADGGGTKLQVVLYDENLRIVNTARMTGTNTILRTSQEVEEDMRRLVEELIPAEITQIEGANLCVLKYDRKFLEILKRRCTVKDDAVCEEGETALAAAGVPYGIVAQAGTGSDAFLIQPNGRITVGAWGYIFGDEGSGYYIGEKTLRAAIYASDGRGPKTRILDILMERWHLEKLWDIVDRAMGGGDYRHLVASASYITSEAAKENDAVALGIYEDAAREMAKQVLVAVARNGGTWQGPVVASGGAWKGHPRMFEAFCGDIRERYPAAEIVHPIFEPVVGCVVLRCFAAGEGFESFSEVLKEGFASFCYHA